jgi:hypothetical protein
MEDSISASGVDEPVVLSDVSEGEIGVPTVKAAFNDFVWHKTTSTPTLNA